eukprot:SAG31_NODE_6598_length_1957_cov_1.244349_2_plen_182_part_00
MIADVDDVRGGGEFGFMSTTADRDVALNYTFGRQGEARTLLTAKMNMASRGAFLGFLSQYPDEDEFLYPPLCGLEVKDDPVEQDGVILYKMDFHTNTTICTAAEGDARKDPGERSFNSLNDSSELSFDTLVNWLRPRNVSAQDLDGLDDAELKQMIQVRSRLTGERIARSLDSRLVFSPVA